METLYQIAISLLFILVFRWDLVLDRHGQEYCFIVDIGVRRARNGEASRWKSVFGNYQVRSNNAHFYCDRASSLNVREARIESKRAFTN
jgi:hypothetical protein